MKEKELIKGDSPFWGRLFFPSSVAVIGASRKKGKVGYEVLNNILSSGFSGSIYPVNPSADEILGMRCYRSVTEVPGDVEVCVIAIPAENIMNAVEECGEKGVKLAVVLTAGFREKGPDGAHLEKEMVLKARSYRMRILGPNCLGFINTILPLNASFAPSMPRRGAIGFISQSGALITSAIDWSLKTGAGFSLMFSIGNRSDLDEVEILDFFAEHEDTRAVAMYVESSAKGRELVEAASRVVVRKPVFILRGGVSEAGVRAASSHTGSIAGSREAWKAGIARAGAVEVESLSELLNASWIACSANPPTHNKVLILTNAGGAGIITSDLVEYRTGGVLKVASLPEKVVKEIKSVLPPEASPSNPVDVLGDAGPDRFQQVMEIITRNELPLSVLLVITPQAMTDVRKIAEKVLSYSEKIPIIGVFIGGDKAESGRQAFIEKGLTAFSFPEDAVKALAGYQRAIREKSIIGLTLKTFRDTYPSRVKEVIEKAAREGRHHLMEIEAMDILKAYGISTPRRHLALSADEAVEAAKKIGFPVVLKIASPDIIHKTEIGGVVVGIEDALSLQHAYSQLILRVRKKLPEARLVGVVVEEMVSGIAEVILGMRRDPDFGPLIMFGLGGIFVEILKDVSNRLAPLSEESVERMFQEVRSIPLLKGFRGRKRGDINALKETLLRFSQLVVENDELLELEINPLTVRQEGKGVVALDARGTFSGR